MPMNQGFYTKIWTHPPSCRCPWLHASLLSRSKMRSLLSGHGNSSPCQRSLSFYQPLSFHSHFCQPLLVFTALIDGLLLRPSLLRRLLPAPLSAAPIIDTFIVGCHVILFLIAPLLPSMMVIPPTTVFNPHTPSCPSRSLVWSSLIRPGLLLHHISSRCHLLSASASACHLATASCCPP